MVACSYRRLHMLAVMADRVAVCVFEAFLLFFDHVESHPYLPQWDLLDYCRKNGIVLQAFAALGHSSEPKLLEDPVISAVAKRVNKTPAQVLLSWAIQRGTALLTTSKTPSRIKENFEVSTLPEEAVREISEGITSRVRFNAVVETGVPGFIPRG